MRLTLWVPTAFVTALLMGASSWVVVRTWPHPLGLATKPLPSIQFRAGTTIVPLPTKVLLGDVGRFDNELSAYLWFDYLRSRREVDASTVLLVVKEEKNDLAVYEIRIVVPNDALTAVPFLADLEAKRYIRYFDLAFSSAVPLAYDQKQTDLFVAAYKRPAAQSLEKLTAKQLLSRTARFVSFKSRTDTRQVGATESRTRGLGPEAASELAADIIAVAKFYDLPLDIFLGIGAMENNYLSIRGDLNHSTWKRRPAKGDIILRRTNHRVLVSNYSVGVWQITRETLRYAHDLYLKDKRDYTQIPPRLIPPRELELDVTDQHVLTTYAGLLLRDLLDRFNGDIEKAVGAYNGGPRNPNLEYAGGVEAVASYARNVLERVTVQNKRAATLQLSGR